MNSTEALRSGVGWIGEQIIYTLISTLGRKVSAADYPWLCGPMGTHHIGDRPYEETAQREGLNLVRDAGKGGLIPDFSALQSANFDPDQVDPLIRDFYEGTAGFTLDTWASTYFPANVALWLLVQTISRRVNQLNFPLDGLDAAKGMTSEIVLLEEADGKIRYTGWFRCMRSTQKAVYTGFYMLARIPGHAGAVVKTVFPMPGGNATVFLLPQNAANGGLRLMSAGKEFGQVGFYRIQSRGQQNLQAWKVPMLHEFFEVYREGDELRCDHRVSFLGCKVLALHYRITGKAMRPN